MSTTMFRKRRWPAAMAALLLAAGLPGPARAATTSCDRCFAVVGADGTLIRYRGVLYASQSAGGQYTVVFARPVNKCAYSATNTITGNYGSGTTVLEVQLSSVNKNTLIVQATSLFTQMPNKSTFSLVVTC